MPVGEYRTAKPEMYLLTGLRTYGSDGWSSTVNIRSVKNVRNASCSHGAGDALPWQAEKTAIFMQRIHSVGRRLDNMGGVNQTARSDHAAATGGREPVTVMDAIMHRRAIRRYDPRQIEEPELQQILEAGMYAPSAGGRQGVIFAVCQDREVNERLGKIKRANSNWRMASGNNYNAVMQLLLGYPRETDRHPSPKPRKEGRIIRV